MIRIGTKPGMVRIAIWPAALLVLMALPIHSTEIIGHRGSPDDAPENTLSSANLAWERGADAVELDIHLTKDGRLIVLHDDDTQRVTGVTGVPEQMTLDELRRLDAGRWKDPRFAGETLPTLDELIATGGGNRRFFIEIKRGPEVVPALKAVLDVAKMRAGQIVIIAFQIKTIRAAKKALPQYKALWLVGYRKGKGAERQPDIEAVIRKAKRAKLDGLDLEQSWPIDAAFVKKVKAAGLGVWVWTVDDPVVGERLVEAGVDGVTTNRCGPLRRQLGLTNQAD